MSDTAPKKLLVISYYWPPTGGSGVQRWVKFCKYLTRMGWSLTVYTPENPEQLARDESLAADVPSEVEVIKRPISEPYAIYRRLFKPSGKGAGLNPLNGQRKSFAQRLAVALRGNLFVPDPRIAWVRPSVRFLANWLKQHPVDAVVTTGPPHSMHLIGRGLKRRTGVRWLADFRDPWTEMFSFKHLGLLPWVAARHRRLEQSVLDEADAVIAVSPRVRDDFAARTSTPVHLLTNGYDEEDFAGPAPEVPADRFRFVHTGLFASDGNPLVLWDILAEKCRSDARFREQMRIRLAGKTDTEILEALRSRGLWDNVEDLGYQPHFKTVEEQRGASVLLLPLRREPEYAKVLPGKIFEYLAARRPVLGIGQEDGAAADILRQTGAGVMFDWDRVDVVRSYVDSLWARHLEGDDSPFEVDASRYSRISITRDLAKII